MDIILLNGQVLVTIFSIIIRYEYMLKRLVSLVCDAVYFNPFANFKKCYTPYEKVKETIVRLNTVIMTKVKVQLVNYVNITARGLNKLSGDTIRLGEIIFIMLHTIKYGRLYF